jgi:hypothetical protein
VLTYGPTGPDGEGVSEEVRDAVTRKVAAQEVEAESSEACLAPAGPAPPRGWLRLRGGRCCSGRLCTSPSSPFSSSFSSRVSG